MELKIDDYAGLKAKVQRYNEILSNTKSYRERWKSGLKNLIVSELEAMIKSAGLNGKIETSEKVKHLEYIILSLGSEKSGISEIVDEKIEKPLIKKNGSLVYQQLFNGKVQVMVMFPHIEGFGDPNPPKIIGIYRPEEIKPPFLIRHMEDFVREITQWEDFDDDDPVMNKIGFNVQNISTPALTSDSTTD